MVTPDISNYGELFKTFLERATESAKAATSDDGLLADPSRLLHSLTIMLRTPEQWHEARDLLFTLQAHFDHEVRYSEWLFLLQSAIAQSKQVGDHESHAILQVYLGNIHRIYSENESAVTVFMETVAYFSAQKGLWYARACHGLAKTLQQMGSRDEAVEWAERGLASLPENEYSERAVSYRILGGVALNRKLGEDAYRHFSKSLELWQQVGDERLIAFGLTNVAAALRALGQYEASESALTTAIDTFKQCYDGYNEGIAHNALGNLYLHQEHYATAIHHYHHAERLVKGSKTIVLLASIYNNWGMAYAGQGEWKRAERLYEQSIRHWEKSENRFDHANALDNLGIAIAKQGDYSRSIVVYKTALEHLKAQPDEDLEAEILSHLAEAEAGLANDVADDEAAE